MCRISLLHSALEGGNRPENQHSMVEWVNIAISKTFPQIFLCVNFKRPLSGFLIMLCKCSVGRVGYDHFLPLRTITVVQYETLYGLSLDPGIMVFALSTNHAPLMRTALEIPRIAFLVNDIVALRKKHLLCCHRRALLSLSPQYDTMAGF